MTAETAPKPEERVSETARIIDPTAFYADDQYEDVPLERRRRALERAARIAALPASKTGDDIGAKALAVFRKLFAQWCNDGDVGDLDGAYLQDVFEASGLCEWRNTSEDNDPDYEKLYIKAEVLASPTSKGAVDAETVRRVLEAYRKWAVAEGGHDTICAMTAGQYAAIAARAQGSQGGGKGVG